MDWQSPAVHVHIHLEPSQEMTHVYVTYDVRIVGTLWSPWSCHRTETSSKIYSQLTILLTAYETAYDFFS